MVLEETGLWNREERRKRERERIKRTKEWSKEKEMVKKGIFLFLFLFYFIFYWWLLLRYLGSHHPGARFSKMVQLEGSGVGEGVVVLSKWPDRFWSTFVWHIRPVSHNLITDRHLSFVRKTKLSFLSFDLSSSSSSQSSFLFSSSFSSSSSSSFLLNNF